MGTDITYELDMFGNPPINTCECCSPRMMTMTSTVGHKWTREEIEREIIAHADMLSTATFWTRGDILRRLKHWTAKLNRLNELQDEFTSIEIIERV